MKMVHKPKTTKLGIQAVSVKPSSGQHPEGKNRTNDLKKKMKRSKSVKLSETENSKSSSSLSPLKKNLDLPGKPPPFTNPSPTTPIKKQSLIKTIDGSGSPNYMKSTSSSKARTESSQVSSHIFDRRNSTTPQSSGSGSSNRPAKTLSRTSSLKLVRTLTKAPSFKHKRSSRVAALCADANLQRSTCSSTMKDYKFPSYLELNHGGTDSEGTSVLKVCPYNYCSLNGHHHGPLPPLKSFLSARRRAMKIQKGVKVEALSPRKKNKPSDNLTVEKDDEFNDAHISPLVKDKSFDFYIEIYAQSKRDEEGEQESGSLSNGPPCSDMEWEDEEFSGLKAENVAELSPEADEQSETNQSDLQLEPVVLSDEPDETEEFNGVGVVLDFTEGEDFKIEGFEISYTVDVEEGASETSSSVLEEECVWINEQNLVKDNLANNQVAPVEVQAKIQQFEIKAEHIEDSQDGICENNCTIDLKEEALEPSNFQSPPLSNQLTDGCNEEPNQELTGLSDYQFETQDDSRIQIEDEKESVLPNAPSEAMDKAMQDFLVPGINRWTARRKRSDEDLEEQRDFNPRGPNFLPLVPEPDGERVDLKHQMMDEKRSAEEWMLDYALRQTVTKLALAKKKKVALLVEAFESVTPLPIPKFESRLRHSSTPFAHGRPIQACS